MERKEHIEQEVEKTLRCFETIENIESDPFFYTRLQAKIRDLEEKKKPARHPGFSIGYYLRPALLVLLVVFNILSAVLVFRGSDTQSDVRQYYLTTFADEYALNQDEYDLFLSTN